jgi:hypothetical protein
MQRILILADGRSAKIFLHRLVKISNKDDIYDVVYLDKSILPDEKLSNINYYQFDPSSLIKLSDLLKFDYRLVLISLKNQKDIDGSISNIRYIHKKLRIVVSGYSKISTNDSVVWIDGYDIVANNLIDHLPNVPVYAQNIGLRLGEIMEVLVPFGSSYSYRHIEAIEQKEWRISALYRKRRLILPNSKQMILPNDELVIIGRPSVLKTVHQKIKQQLGQFPAPYGENVYLIIDMLKDKEKHILHLLKEAIYLKNKLNKKLMVRIINSSQLSLLYKIKSIDNIDRLEIDYFNKNLFYIIQNDIKNFGLGLIVVSKLFFNHKTNKAILQRTLLPVMKFSNASFEDIDTSFLLLNESKEMEKISTTIFDIGSMLNLNLELVEYNIEENEHRAETIEHFQSLSNIFSKKIQINSLDENPLRAMQKKENMLYCLPFNNSVVKTNWFSLFSTKTEEHCSLLEKFHQIFIPVNV